MHSHQQLLIATLLTMLTACPAGGGGGGSSSTTPLGNTANNGTVGSVTPDGGGNTSVPPPAGADVIPTAVIKGVQDGGIYGDTSLTADASASSNVVSQAWSLTGPNGLRYTSKSAAFTFLLPLNPTADPVQYELTLTTTSSDGHTATTSAHLIAASKPVAEIVSDDVATVTYLTAADAPKVATAGKLLTFSVGKQSEGSFTWSAQEKNPSSGAVTDIVLSDPHQKEIQFKAMHVNYQYVVQLVVTSVDGRADTATLAFRADYGAWATLASSVSNFVLVNAPMKLTCTVNNTDGTSIDIASYAWSGTLDGAAITGQTTSTNSFNVNTSKAGYLFVRVAPIAKDGTPVGGGLYAITVANPPVPSIGITPATKVAPPNQAVTLKAAATDAGIAPPAYAWTITGPSGVSPTTLSGATASYTPTVPGTYTVTVTVTNMDDKFTGSATDSFTVQPVPVAKIQSTDILPGHSYSPTTILHASDASTGGGSASWSLQLQNSTKAPTTFTGTAITLPKLAAGAYVLSLVSTNGGGSATATLSFNIRPKIVTEFAPPSSVTAIAATGPTNIFAGQFHFGADNRWSKVDSPCAAADAIYTRSASEVYFASGNKVCKFTDSNGIVLVGNVPASTGFTVKQLTGDAKTLYAVTTEKMIYQSADNGGTWTSITELDDPKYNYKIESAVMHNNGKLIFTYDITAGSNLFMSMKTFSPGTAGSTGVVSGDAGTLPGIVAISVPSTGNTFYLGDMNGKIYTGTPSSTSSGDFLVATPVGSLPKVMVQAIPTQELIKAISADQMTVLTQNGGIYNLNYDTVNKKFPVIHTSDATVDASFAITSGAINAAGTFASKSDGTFMMYKGGTVDKWYPSLYLQTTLSKTATKVSARAIGSSVFLLNAQDLGNLGTFQEIRSEGNIIPIFKSPATIYGAWGPDEKNVYFLKDTGLWKWDGSKATAITSVYKDQKGNVITIPSSEVFVDIGGTSATDFYVATNLNVYHTIDSGSTFVLFGSPASSGMAFTSVYENGGTLFIGSDPSTTAGITGAGALIFRGASDGGLFAVQGGKTIYQRKVTDWQLVTGTGYLLTQPDCVVTDFSVLSQDEAWFGAACSSGSPVVGRSKGGAVDTQELFFAPAAQFVGAVGDQVYFGGAIGTTDTAIHAYQYGPIQ